MPESRCLPLTSRAIRSQFKIQNLYWILALVALTPVSASGGDPPRMTIKIVSDGKSVLGRPLAMTKYDIIMLRRDGRMLDFDANQVQSAEQVSNNFAPYTSLKIQDHLQKLFGKGYEVSRTAHYVVVHPRGMRKQWAEPFEALYNRFLHYFSVRGYTRRPPEFPMVVVVFNSRSEFNRVAIKDGLSNPNAFAGYYSQTSNWIVTWNDRNTNANNSTLIHEALHQYAFNVGIHNRWAATPKWCSEGLATMFEARGVNDSRRFTSAKDRLDPYYLRVLQRRIGQKPPAGLLEALVSSDQLFERDVELGYALSWGLVWYLAETRQSSLNSYLQKIADRPRLEAYTSADRVADFRQAFGIDFTMLQSHFVKYLNESK